MRIDDWRPIYETILDAFGFGERADQLARNRLARLTAPFDLDRLDMQGQCVAVAGGAPCLEAEVRLAEQADVVIAASDAGARLASLGVEPALVVTDLDGAPADTLALARQGVPVAIHAHGDNVGALSRHVGRFPPAMVLATTQTDPVEGVYNAGGFTDGDRAAFLADELGAARLRFPGWEFDDPAVGAVKQQKLRWAQRLLRLLERRRDERFPVLDGHRSRIDLRRLYRTPNHL